MEWTLVVDRTLLPVRMTFRVVTRTEVWIRWFEFGRLLWSAMVRLLSLLLCGPSLGCLGTRWSSAHFAFVAEAA